MDQLFFHPKLVHLPIALAVLMPLVTGGVVVAIWRGWFDHRVWALVLLLQAALVGSGAAAMNTGEIEEERVEQFIAEQYVEAHEAAAEVFVWAGVGLLLLMAVSLALPEGRSRRAAYVFSFVGTLIVFGLGYETGELGGRLVYEHGAAQIYVENAGVYPELVADDGSPADDSDSH